MATLVTFRFAQSHAILQDFGRRAGRGTKKQAELAHACARGGKPGGAIDKTAGKKASGLARTARAEAVTAGLIRPLP